MDAQARKLWTEILENPELRLVGGEIEFLEGGERGEIYRGPIVDIRMIDLGLFVNMGWVARLGLNEKWILDRHACPSLLIPYPPEIQGYTIQFALHRGSGWIFPQGTEQIPRIEILGLAA